ncbi:uncharacterized protein TM35_000062780 [Trypanosoma theileri]|uniref:Uncharacterized protein n=1 Tax=Trypanosoma theileri TaxID=67003 RepID=A0A1X0P3K9_9TRYP|nr:uncharacterized protein TM35_000062780 [Trypanosoma theileri]ORC91273.1 hypothetical protein TM35_000062780 [Trypanosoma theileri]
MVHSAKYGRTRYTRNRTYYAPGGALPSPTSRGEFSVLRVPCVSRLRALLGLVTVVLGHIFAHKLTLVGVGCSGVLGCAGLVASLPSSVTTLAGWWCRGGVAVFWSKQAASRIVAPLLFWCSIGFYSSFGRS